jgi:hypothetical protein
MSDYPSQLLCREAPGAYVGEPAFSLWHFSEDPKLNRFEPHVPATNPDAPPLVWAIDSRHAPLYWFPRDCPRACIWPVSTTTSADRAAFFARGESRVHIIESSWIQRMQTAVLFAYRLPVEPFEPNSEVGGYWISHAPVEAAERVEITDLLARHAHAGIGLRTVGALGPLWATVVSSTVEFSGIRLRNSPTAVHQKQRAPGL